MLVCVIEASAMEVPILVAPSHGGVEPIVAEGGGEVYEGMLR